MRSLQISDKAATGILTRPDRNPSRVSAECFDTVRLLILFKIDAALFKVFAVLQLLPERLGRPASQALTFVTGTYSGWSCLLNCACGMISIESIDFLSSERPSFETKLKNLKLTPRRLRSL